MHHFFLPKIGFSTEFDIKMRWGWTGVMGGRFIIFWYRGQRQFLISKSVHQTKSNIWRCLFLFWQKMPLDLLRSTHPSAAALDEELSPTDCSEDSVEIRSPRPTIFRPSAILATPPTCLKRSSKHWTDSEQPEEKRMRRMDMAGPPPLTPFYPPALKLAGSSHPGHPHDALLLDAERSRLLHWMSAGRLDENSVPGWMRTNWPLAPTPADAAAHLMTSALHYYPHLLHLPPPHHPFLHPPPIYLSSYGLPHPALYHRPTLSAEEAPVSKLPVRPVTPPPPLPPPPPPPATTEKGSSKEASKRREIPASGEKSSAAPLHHRRSSAISQQVRSKKPRKIAAVNGPSGKRLEKPPSSSAVPFLSVETLLSRETTAIVEPEEEAEEAEEARWTPRPAFREQPNLPGQLQHPSGGSSSAASNRNYKNMTRERRMQANARERTRVHTISAAFEALRRAVPSFSHGQRLSKLSILRVASAYIAALGQLAGDEDQMPAASNDSLAECVDRCTRTLMTEGQMLRRKQRPGAPQQPPTDDEEDDEDDWWNLPTYLQQLWIID